MDELHYGSPPSTAEYINEAPNTPTIVIDSCEQRKYVHFELHPYVTNF